MSVRDQSASPLELSTPPFERRGRAGDDDANLDFLLSVWTRRNGRDLASEEIWEESVMRARLKRRAVAHRPLLSQARSLTVSLVAAAATAAAPAAGLAHPRSSSGGVASAKRSVLELGDRGSRVTKLQRLLGITADGVFGPQTRKAVRSFQQKRGLTVDGIVGPQTWSALTSGGSPSGGAKKADGVLEVGDRGAKVAQLQRLLGIPADGVFGPKTRAAVRSFQQKRGLTVDGIVGPQTWGALTSGTRASGGAKKGGGVKKGDGVLEMGERGARVAKVQRLLGIPADGVFGPQTRAAVRAFQARKGLTVDGKIGPQTWAVLRSGGGAASASSSTTTASTSSGPAAVRGVDRRLWAPLALARKMGLSFMSGHRAGASIGGGGKRSDHAYYPSKAIDVGGSAADMRRYARAVAGNRGVQTVIYGPVGIWIAGLGWRATSAGTYRDHLDHVHVDTF